MLWEFTVRPGKFGRVVIRGGLPGERKPSLNQVLSHEWGRKVQRIFEESLKHGVTWWLRGLFWQLLQQLHDGCKLIHFWDSRCKATKSLQSRNYTVIERRGLRIGVRDRREEFQFWNLVMSRWCSEGAPWQINPSGYCFFHSQKKVSLRLTCHTLSAKDPNLLAQLSIIQRT